MSEVTIDVDSVRLVEALRDSGFSIYSWWHEVEWMDDLATDTAVMVEVLDPDDELGMPITSRLTHKYLMDGLQAAIDGQQVDPLTGLSLSDWVQGRADMDAVLGDLVVQCAMFGKSIYG